MTRTWMPLYIGDYLRDTAHLSAAEHGAYLLLIMHYWQQGELPLDDKRLARIARMTVEEWADSRDTIAEFFDEGWKHSRIDAELKGAAENSARAREKAAKRWAGRDEQPDPAPKPQQSRGNATAQPQQEPEQCPSPSPREPNGSDDNSGRKPHRLPANYRLPEVDREFARALGWTEAEIDDGETDFVEYWSNPKLKASQALKTNWSATWRNRVRDLGKRRGANRGGRATGPPAGPARGAAGSLWTDRMHRKLDQGHFDEPPQSNVLQLSASPQPRDGHAGGPLREQDRGEAVRSPGDFRPGGAFSF